MNTSLISENRDLKLLQSTDEVTVNKTVDSKGAKTIIVKTYVIKTHSLLFNHAVVI